MKKSLEEIMARLAEIIDELSKEETTEEEVTALEKEAEELEEEKKSLLATAEKRKATLNKIRNGVAGNVLEEQKAEERGDINMNKEYRSAFLKKIRGLELTDAEQRAFAINPTDSGATAVVPEETAEEIIKKLKEKAPLLNEITLLNVKGSVKFAVEGVKNPAQSHVENADIDGDEDTLVTVNLNGYEIVKKVVVSRSVMTMSINAFENWLTDMISEMIADKITTLIITGSGTNQATGISKANTWGATNSVTVGKTADLTTTDVQTLLGLLNGGYAKGAKLLMSRKTLYTDFLPLQDNAKNTLVKFDGDKAFIYGYEVLEDDSVALHDAYFGNFKKYVGNLAEEVEINSGLDLDTNSFKFLGSAIFDGKPAIGEAFVKLTKATA